MIKHYYFCETSSCNDIPKSFSQFAMYSSFLEFPVFSFERAFFWEPGISQQAFRYFVGDQTTFTWFIASANFSHISSASKQTLSMFFVLNAISGIECGGYNTPPTPVAISR